MKGEAKQFLKFIDGSDKRFIIPVYQRNYSWQNKHCAQLLNDLKGLIKKPDVPHFFGSIVSSHMQGGKREDFLIIDGQQRLTTISILLIAIVDLLKHKKVIPKDDRLIEKITKKHLVDEYQEDQRKIRLKPIKDDCKAFDALFGDESDFVDGSNVTSNFRYFRDRILNENIDIDDLYDAISRLQTIDIFLEKDDDPQLIFESLNSTGLELEEGDKIRNFILMGLSSELQEKYYEAFWNKIEKNTHFKVSDFFKDYLTLKLNRTVVIKDIYFTFKDYVKKNNDDIEALLQDLLEYSKLYAIILNPMQYQNSFTAVLVRLSQLEFTVIFPVVLAILKRWNEKNLTDQEVTELLRVTEIFLFRRLIVGLATNALSKIFATLDKDVTKKAQFSQLASYAEIYKYVLLNKEESSRFPNDEEFEQALFSRNIYAMSSKNKAYLFSFLENEESKEQINVIERIKDGTYTIEHIMPQTLSPVWQKELGEKSQQVHEQWLHTLPNLTLTGYNSKYSNRPFKDKLDVENGFKDSNLRLNQYVRECLKWTEEELIERQSRLSKKSLKLWYYPTTSYAPPVEETNEYLLEDDFDFTGYTLVSYTLYDVESKVQSWKEMQIDVVKYLLEQHTTKIMSLCADQKFYDLSLLETTNNFTEISRSVFLYTNCSTRTKINILKKIFEQCDVEQSELSFLIKKDSNV
ncbi:MULTISPECIES: DUF262 domain-containing protein [Acinetobacter calcoaceticus/baumannii complex]|uniref:DUF262 domain-containing protein n=1 Tax=Acinetobacter calcoaceticus/baumannii complex TaxID=909768 RepID=UPI0002AE9778|nr:MULTISPECIES: DUF262 domain-containing protein [Acinetobacter calcoaceticus/baumannii complex]MDQ9824858.1 DUF262 domain-containing protein [Acinetobacter sp. 163]ELW98635.1 PF03235 family protein [Acinetobacter baumannii OIFC047]MDE9412256.1 DUF262 domain-containing protein [Acinetobacter nosocomialis]TPT64962.1 DUF262 domain-containing protein [Acinetobacter baumannii]HAV3521324.1 DUF262 domain-containing protein [Acinetobacter baumannii]